MRFMNRITLVGTYCHNSELRAVSYTMNLKTQQKCKFRSDEMASSQIRCQEEKKISTGSNHQHRLIAVMLITKTNRVKETHNSYLFIYYYW